jgi:hypothetical protein
MCRNEAQPAQPNGYQAPAGDAPGEAGAHKQTCYVQWDRTLILLIFVLIHPAHFFLNLLSLIRLQYFHQPYILSARAVLLIAYILLYFFLIIQGQSAPVGKTIQSIYSGLNSF